MAFRKARSASGVLRDVSIIDDSSAAGAFLGWTQPWGLASYSAGEKAFGTGLRHGTRRPFSQRPMKL